ncbi:hypothetical protein HDU89_008695 [Geranomyces variabilis]|nr:hypothetical protein HDU89_008695 [Geranomyces variabilis]
MSSPAASSTSSSSKSTSSSASHSSVSRDAASPFYFGDPTYLPVRRRSVRLIERVARRFHLNVHDDHDHVPRDPETGRKIRSATSASSTSTPQRASHHADTDDRSRRRPRSDSPPPQIKGRRKSSLGLLSPAPPLPSATSYEFPLTSSSSSSPLQQHNDPVDLLALIESYSRPESVIAYGTALPPPPRRQAGPRPTVRRRSAVVLPAFHRRPSYTLTSAPLETPMSDISVDPFDHVMVDEDAEEALDATGSNNNHADKGTLHLLDHATAVGFDTLLFGDNRKTIKVSLTPTFIASAAR